ncbi:MAG: phosphoribosylamine--glycine ligase [Candidatus Omnitrophica bacterium]|nr:phosphoribosylamine--glycine ligase [Candidatus Omnitrophota bacterium]
MQSKRKVKILVVGSGGREHALVWKIRQSELVEVVYAAPGNAGMHTIAECVPIDVMDIEGLVKFAKDRSIDLTVVGPEAPLVAGIADRFQQEGLLLFGPNKSGAQLEGSKVFSKNMMNAAGVPTAKHEVFTEVAQAKEYIIKSEPPFVIKVDGLAAGKGVIIAHSAAEGIEAINGILSGHSFGDAGKRIIIEEYLEGEELSAIVFTDGENVLPLVTSQDHKRAYDHDEGPNTGGMGAVSPSPLVSQDDVAVIVNKAIVPIIREFKHRAITFRGVIYAGLMITKKGPMVLEYNVRFGDPEIQAIIPRLRSDIVPLLFEVALGEITMDSLSWDARPCTAIVMASKGYPNEYEKGAVIEGLEGVNTSEVTVFHAGTKFNQEGKVVTNGGRVLAVSALGDNLKDAQQKAYQAIEKIKCDDLFFRTDIGEKAIRGCEHV